ncbi:MAG: zinc-dependent alcohol dehydrogenase family protein [Caldimonas sp.]
MKAMLMMAPGGPDVLQAADVAMPEPGPRDLLVQVKAAGVNPLDTKVRKLHMFYPNVLPVILGCDGAGTVEAVGREVTRFRPGDDVYFFDGGLGSAPGSYATFTRVHEDYAARKPSSLSMVEAAAVPLVLITAWEALIERADLQPGETVLIHAGAGGVGHIAIQLAKQRGARVASTVSGNAKAALVESLGAERAIDYVRHDFVQQTLEWTGGKGADVVFDTVGGPTFCESFAAARLYGRLATLLSTGCPLPQINKARMRNITVAYVQMTTPLFLAHHEQRCRQTRILEAGARLFDEGKLRIEVGRVMPLAEAAAAHALVEEGHTTGKVVLQVE